MVDVDAYMARISYEGSVGPDMATLQAIIRHHTRVIPFENLDQLTGRIVSLDIEALEAKLVGRQRGGYCLEHNQLLMHVLNAVGFRTTGLAGRVRWSRSPSDPPGGRGHMLLIVDLEDRPFIVDVGFGCLTLTEPLLLSIGVQSTANGRYRLTRVHGGDYLLDAETAAGWSPLYTFDLTPAYRADYDVSNWYLCTHPESRFVRRLSAARVTAGGRLTLDNNRLRLRAQDGQIRDQTLASVQEMKEILYNRFLIDVPTTSEIERALARLLVPGRQAPSGTG